LRGMSSAHAAVRWLPAWCARIRKVEQAGALVQAREQAVPRGWLLACFLCSPIAWWLVVMAALTLRYAPGESAWPRVALALAILTLLLRLVFGAWAWVGALTEDLAARRLGDQETGAASSWYLTSLGLPAAGLVSFYAFCFFAARVQHDALGAALAGSYKRHSAALSVLNAPPLSEAQNAYPVLRAAESALPGFGDDYSLFSTRWNSPDGARFVINGAGTLAQLQAAAALEQYVDVPDLAMPFTEWNMLSRSLIKSRNCQNLLVIRARYAAHAGNWSSALGWYETALRVASHNQKSSHLISVMIAYAQEDIALTAMMPTFAMEGMYAPPDETLAAAQRILREHQARRGRPLGRIIRINTLQDIREFDRQASGSSTLWPGDMGILSFYQQQPLLVWLGRKQYLRWQEQLSFFAESSDPAQAMYMSSKMNMDVLSACSPSGIGEHSVRIVWVELEHQLSSRLLDAALAVRRYRLKHRRSPDSLEDCVPDFLPAVPEDPCAPGMPLRFIPTRVYAPGTDRCYSPEKHPQPFFGKDELLGLAYGSMDEDKGLFMTPNLAATPCLQMPPGAEFDAQPDAELLFDPAPFIRRDTARRLERGGTAASACLPAILKLEQDQVPEFRMWAAYLLGTCDARTPEARQALERLAKDKDEYVRHFASEAHQRLFSSLPDTPAPTSRAEPLEE